MIKVLFNGLLNLLASVMNFVLTPINLLFANLFPDMTSAIATFNNFVSSYLGSGLAYFFSMFPPIFRNLLVLWFTFVVAYYGIIYTYIGFVKLWSVIQKIKFW